MSNDALKIANEIVDKSNKKGEKGNSISILKEERSFSNDIEILSIKPRQFEWTASDLLATEFPEPRWIIPQLIPEGLVFIGGRPKVGKSWLALQMSIAVASGGMFFGKKIEKREVLYIALEDNPRRIQERLKQLCVPQELTLEIHFSMTPLQQGGLEKLLKLQNSEHYGIILIDTYSRAISGLKQDSPLIGSMLGALQANAMKYNSTIFFTDHTRKKSFLSPDPIDDLIGQTDKSGIADTILVIYREQGKKSAILAGRGREIEQVNLAIEWDSRTCCWQILGNADEVHMGEAQNEILATLESLEKAQAATIAKEINRDRGNTYKNLQKLIELGKIFKETFEGKTYYAINKAKQPIQPNNS